MSKEAKIGIFFVAALLILGIIFELLGGVSLFEDRITLRARFDDVGELKEGNPVKLSGLKIGEVDRIEIGGDKIVVSFKVRRDAPVRKDSVASIRLTSLLGISYVNLSFGDPASPLAAEGDVLPSEESANINDILVKLDKTVSSFDVVLGENKDRIADILEGLDTVLGAAARGEGTLGRLIKDDSLYVEAKGAFENLNAISKTIREGRGTIGRLVADDSLYVEAESSLKKLGELAERLSTSKGTMGKLLNDDKLYDNAAEAAANLNQILKRINNGEGTLGKLVVDDSLYYDAQNATRKLEKTMDLQEDLAPLQTLGTAFGILTVF